MLDGCDPLPGGSNSLLVVYKSVLPVTWVKTNAFVEKGKVILQWIVANEFNNRGYSIYKSYTGDQFEKIDFVPTVGNNSQHTYNYADKTLQATNDVVFYKIEQTDIDGASSFSPVMKVVLASPRMFSISPNPATNELRLFYKGMGNTEVTILNSRGLAVYKKTMVINGTTVIPLSHLSSGTYVVTLKAGGEQYVQRVFIRH